MPGWTWIDESKERSEEEIERITPFLDYLARQITNFRTNQERQAWAYQADIEDGRYDERYEDDAEGYRHEAMQRVKAAREEAEENALTDALHEHGARMMRPYEHWNEDEVYMAYAERDR